MQQDATSSSVPIYAPNRTLPRDPKTGKASPDLNDDGTPINAPHTQLGNKSGTGKNHDVYPQGRTFDENGEVIEDTHHTTHPNQGGHHPNPHKHRYKPNPSGSPQRGPAESVDNNQQNENSEQNGNNNQQTGTNNQQTNTPQTGNNNQQTVPKKPPGGH